MSRDLFHEWMWYEQNPDHRLPEKKEQVGWRGYDESFDIFPHLKTDWKELQRLAEETGKPIVDLGASYSSLAMEGVLRGVDIIPVDSTFTGEVRSSYEKLVTDRALMNRRFLDAYLGRMPIPLSYREQWKFGRKIEDLNEIVSAGEAAARKAIMAEIKKLPFPDRGVSVALAHDSVPKHSRDFESFLNDELPEILRVTDRVARIYPMAIYREEMITTTPSKGIPSLGVEKEEVLVESHPLYKDQEAIAKISEVAKQFGFDFTLEVGGTLKGGPHSKSFELGSNDEQAMLGVFTRSV